MFFRYLLEEENVFSFESFVLLLSETKPKLHTKRFLGEEEKTEFLGKQISSSNLVIKKRITAVESYNKCVVVLPSI